LPATRCRAAAAGRRTVGWASGDWARFECVQAVAVLGQPAIHHRAGHPQHRRSVLGVGALLDLADRAATPPCAILPSGIPGGWIRPTTPTGCSTLMGISLIC
jgi:hypothetical protein